MDREAMGSQRVGLDWATELNWKITTNIIMKQLWTWMYTVFHDGKYQIQNAKKKKLSCKGIILDNENDDISILLFN